jgi:two-component sensor histidine kinase
VHRRWTIATIMFGAAVAGFVGSDIHLDRKAALAAVEDRTRSFARMTAAHAEASIGHGVGVLQEIETRIAKWDLQDQAMGRAIFDETRALIGSIPAFASAWVVDAEAINRLDTWTFPAKPIDASERPYFKAHLATGGNELLIMGDAQPGSITGRERFTISRAQRRPDGTLQSIVVVAVYRHVFDALYKEAANWPDARGGLYSLNGDILARLPQPVRASPEFIAAIQRNLAETASGTAILPDGGASRLVSWHRLRAYPSLYATSSQTLTTALAAWRLRSSIMAGIGLAAIAAFALFALMSARATRAEQDVLLQAMTIREVHHRVKNALALVIGMVHLQERKEEDPQVRERLHEVSLRLQAVTEVQELLQSAQTLAATDVGTLLSRLCERLDGEFGKILRCEAESGIDVDTNQATTIAIIANELITNGMKHAASTVSASCRKEGRVIVVNITSDSGPLPEDFDLQSSPGFGLRMAKAMADGGGGQLLARNSASGVQFELRLPLQQERQDTPPDAPTSGPGP